MIKLGGLIDLKVINEGTKSHVGIIEPNGRIGSTYVHYDGYPQNMKGAIKHHFKNVKMLKTLLKKVEIQGLYKGKEPEYYGKMDFLQVVNLMTLKNITKVLTKEVVQ